MVILLNSLILKHLKINKNNEQNKMTNNNKSNLMIMIIIQLII